jgi:predicted LPLAT superfamily acyltransferase
MDSWEGKSKGNISGYKIFVWTLKHLGINFSYFLLLFVSAYFVFTSKRTFKPVFYYFHLRLRNNKFKSIVNIFKNYFFFGQVLIDKTAILSGLKSKYEFLIEGLEYLLQMQKGGILISGHIGNWEIGGQALNLLNKKINILASDNENESIKQYMSKVLSGRDFHFINIGDNFSHLQEIEKALANNEIIAIHGDRFIDGNKTVKINFLDEDANFPIGPWNIASHFNVPVSYVFAVKESHKKYRFCATPLKQVPVIKNPLKRSAAFKDLIAEYAKELEKMVKQYPTQWYNYYDFWGK